MKLEIKAQWVTALRSGKYVQGRTNLKDNIAGTHCCLGVLTELYAKEHNLNFTGDGPFLKSPSERFPELGYEMLCPAVMEWAGLIKEDPVIHVPLCNNEDTSDHCTLSNLNDDNTTFNQIADLIEQQL